MVKFSINSIIYLLFESFNIIINLIGSKVIQYKNIIINSFGNLNVSMSKLIRK